MGSHDFPPESIERDSYIDLVCNEMIPEISRNGLAEFCDIFCEEGYFDHEQTKRICNIAKRNNLGIKLLIETSIVLSKGSGYTPKKIIKKTSGIKK